MNVTVALDARYSVAPDGSVWSQFGMARSFWERYLEVFDSVTVVARAARVDRAPEGWLPVTGKHISFQGVPDFCGPWQCLTRYPAVRSAVRSTTPARGAVILRVGSQISNMMESRLRHSNHPYGLEVVGDPYEVFAPGVVDHPLRRFFRWHFSRQLRNQCRRAVGVAYVTARALQERYPTESLNMNISDVDLPEAALHRRAFSTPCSSIELEAANLLGSIHLPGNHRPYQLVTVGSLAQLYKGTDVLIQAIARCVRSGLDLTAIIVGDGNYRTALMAQAERLGMGSRILFPGQVTSGIPVRRLLDAADLFVLPSRTEGLPRALIEAMARALPCIGSDVGGIPELLDASEMVPAGDPIALAAKIQEVLSNPRRMEAMGQRNLEVARGYLDTNLAERRRQFYTYILDYTQRWEALRRA